MDERLMIRATPELLDGWCGPVWALSADGGLFASVVLGVSTQVPAAYTVSADPHDDEWCAEDFDLPCFVSLHFLRLDLSRAECRDRVARVLGGTPHYTYRAIHPGGPHILECGARWWHQRYRSHSGPQAPGVPALAGLDPHDDTRLPDGSRLVHALALAAVWREVSR